MLGLFGPTSLGRLKRRIGEPNDAEISGSGGWMHDACSHLKVIGSTLAAQPLLDAAGVVTDEGILLGTGSDAYLNKVSVGRIYEREPSVRTTF